MNATPPVPTSLAGIASRPGQPANALEAPVKIDVNALNFYYGPKRALDGISIQIRSNLVTAFIGPSGCGKSTFLRTLNRMNDIIPMTRVEGKVLIDGESIYGAGVDVVHLRRKVGMVFQKSNPFPKSIFENVAYGLRINGLVKSKAEMADRVEESLRRRRFGTRPRTACTTRRWPCRAANSSASASRARWPSVPRSC
jgi:phosphate transport system ATP-binding protein